MLKLEQNFLNLFRFQKIKCLSCAALQKCPPQSLYQLREIHVSSSSYLTRKFKGMENEYMFQLISKNCLDYPVPAEIEEVESLQEFDNLLKQNYRERSEFAATRILNTFKAVEKFCCLHQINISDTRFDNLVDGLMDHCKNLTDNEILELLILLGRLPRCSSYRDHNYHDVWSCLDDISRERFAGRDINFLFKVAEAWYELDLGRIGEYVYDFLDVLVNRNHHLNKEQIVKAFFFMNVCRRKEVPFEMEEVVEKHLKEFNIDELGVIALGYFKTKSKIKLKNIILGMMKAVKHESSTVNQITLSSILKVLRFSKIGPYTAELDDMLNVLMNEVDRLSSQCCLHIANIGSGIIHYHEPSMIKATQKLVDRMEDKQEVRLKDIERLLVATTMVDYKPKVTPDLFEMAFKEIHESRRLDELASFPRILPCILGCLSKVNLYSYTLMNRILDVDYIFDTYGKNIINISNDIYTLDCCIDVECPDYNGNRLPPHLKYRSVKWLMCFTPSHDQPKKLTVYDTLHLDVEEQVLSIVKNKNLMRVDYVVPHFGRADIILCKDKSKNEFIEPPGFERYVLGDVKFALEDPNLLWYAISIIGWNNTVRNTSRPVGMVVMKQRHLKKIGYNSRLVIWNQYMKLSQEKRREYIESLLR